MKKLFLIPLTFLTFSIFSCTSDDDTVNKDEDIEDNLNSSEDDENAEGENSSDVEEEETKYTIESFEITNILADAVTDFSTGAPVDSGEFTKFDFETGEITDSETDWDIAFRTTAIAVNGGEATGANDEPERNANVSVALVDGIFSEITSAEDLIFSQDSVDGYAIPKTSEEGWYSYDFATNIVSPIPGKILVFKTRNGNYAKVQIESYYLDGDTSGDSRYYTFNYLYNTEVDNTSFE